MAKLLKQFSIFFRRGKLLREVKHALTTLVPKCTNYSNLSYFRPISAMCYYKIMSKILSNISQAVEGELVLATSVHLLA